MAFRSVQLHSLDSSDINRLRELGVPESPTIEYKRQKYAQNDEGNHELAADISAFANSSGGDLIIGIEARDGVPTGFVDVGRPSCDSELLRMENVIRTAIEPRIVGLQMRLIEIDSHTTVLFLRIPRSWNAPHRVTLKGRNKFYLRNSSGKYEASMDELRLLFTRGESMLVAFQNLAKGRISEILNGYPACPIKANGTLVLHISSAQSLQAMEAIDISIFESDPWSCLLKGTTAVSKQFNADGYLIYSGAEFPVRAYSQILRNGSVEAVLSDVIRTKDFSRTVHPAPDPSVRQLLDIIYLQEAILDYLVYALQRLQTLGLEPPFYVLVTLLGGEAAYPYVALTYDSDHQTRRPLGRGNVTLPMAVLDNGFDASVWPSQVRPILDALWNIGGHSRCMDFTTDGLWKPIPRC